MHAPIALAGASIRRPGGKIASNMSLFRRGSRGNNVDRNAVRDPLTRKTRAGRTAI